MKYFVLAGVTMFLGACAPDSPTNSDGNETEGVSPGAVVAIPDFKLDPGGNAIVTILPKVSDNPNAVAYCKRDAEDLLVEFQNIGELDTDTSVEVTVTFETSSGPVTGTDTRGPLAVGEITTLPYVIPEGCFNADCEFAISWSNQGPVGGRCIG